MLLVLLLSPLAFITPLAQGDGSGRMPSDAVRCDESPQERLRRLSDRELLKNLAVLERQAIYQKRELAREKDPGGRAQLRDRLGETEADMERARAELLRRRR
jgi:hypothetical protein